MRIVVIGAGATGLAAAYDLGKAGHTVTVFEAGSEVGGLAAGFKDLSWDWTLEKFYHHWFETDRDVLGLIDEIGHAGKVVFPSPTTSLWTPEGIYPLDRPVAGSALLSRVVNVLGPCSTVCALARSGWRSSSTPTASRSKNIAPTPGWSAWSGGALTSWSGGLC
jgi:protoporphyrinogen oxidase